MTTRVPSRAAVRGKPRIIVLIYHPAISGVIRFVRLGLGAVIRTFCSDGVFVALSSRSRLEIQSFGSERLFFQQRTFAAVTTNVSVADFSAFRGAPDLAKHMPGGIERTDFLTSQEICFQDFP